MDLFVTIIKRKSLLTCRIKSLVLNAAAVLDLLLRFCWKIFWNNPEIICKKFDNVSVLRAGLSSHFTFEITYLFECRSEARQCYSSVMVIVAEKPKLKYFYQISDYSIFKNSANNVLNEYERYMIKIKQELRVTSWELRVASCKFKFTSWQLESTSY